MPILISKLGPDPRGEIRQQALKEGFSDIGYTHPQAVSSFPEALGAFLEAGHHGSMAWLADRAEWRADPSKLWPEARSIIMLAESYTPEQDPLEGLKYQDNGNISVYARGADYHDKVKKRLKRLARWLVEKSGAQVKVFVDTAPVPEKPLAQASGLGWQGKHTNLLSRSLGNWFFIGAIFTTLEIPPDSPEKEHCGSCRRCLDICPTNAFPAPYQLDARRCISYLTIEHKGPVDASLRPLMGNRIYGCDDCLAVCPWNKFAQKAQEISYKARAGMIGASLAELAALNDAAFRERYRGSPIKRIGRNRFVRNVLYAIGNSGNPNLGNAARALLNDADATVADAASWALERLSDQKV